jgi:hypothetical protein
MTMRGKDRVISPILKKELGQSNQDQLNFD